MPAELMLTEEVEWDIAEAYGWYEDRRPGLGEDFMARVDARLQSIRRMPDSYGVVYMVIFDWQPENNVVTVYAVMHSARDPEKWKKRLRD